MCIHAKCTGNTKEAFTDTFPCTNVRIVYTEPCEKSQHSQKNGATVK